MKCPDLVCTTYHIKNKGSNSKTLKQIGMVHKKKKHCIILLWEIQVETTNRTFGFFLTKSYFL